MNAPSRRDRLGTALQDLPLRALLTAKGIYQRCLMPRTHDKRILFILGCQRSGTSIMRRIFDRDLQTKVYGEFSALNSSDRARRLRLNPLDQVASQLGDVRAGCIVVKPIVESQRARALLTHFEEARVLWMFRHYESVAHSNIDKFGRENPLNDLRPIVQGADDNWRSEQVPESIREAVRARFSDDLPAEDAAALFWFVRNSLFFEQGLDGHDRVMLCEYDAFVQNPYDTMREVYGFLEWMMPGRRIVKAVSSHSLHGARRVRVSRPVDALCAELWERLVETRRRSAAQPDARDAAARRMSGSRMTSPASALHEWREHPARRHGAVLASRSAPDTEG